MRASSGDGILVCAAQCDQCLFSRNKVVSDARRRELLQQLHRDDTNFQCHKATIAGRHAICRGDYDRGPHRTMALQIGHRLNALIFVDEDGFVVSQGGSDGSA